MNLQLVFAITILFGIYYTTGTSLKHILRLKYKGFNVLVGFLAIFGLFHILAIIPTLLHLPFDLIAYRILPLVLMMAVIMTVVRFFYYRHYEFEKINKWLMITTLVFLSLYYLFDFIVFGDASFYLPLIKQNIGVEHVYLDGGSPWSGNPNLEIGYMRAFVTYELFVGSLASIFQVDSTIFSVNVMSALNLIIILTSWYSFFSHLFKKEVRGQNAYLLFLFMFICSNVTIHRVFHPLNAFNFMTNLYAGKTIYFYAVLPLFFIIINKVSKLTKGSLFIVLFALNLIVPGLTASSLFMQLILSLSVFAYFLLIRQPEDITLGKFLLSTLTPLSIHYLVMIFLRTFNHVGILMKMALLITAIFISVSSYYLVLNDGHILKTKKRIIRLGFIYIYTLIALISTGYFIYFLINHPLRWNYVGTFIQAHVRNGFNLIIFYAISILGMNYILKDDDREHQLSLIFFWLPIILVVLFLNPFTGFLTARLITSFSMYHRILYLFPLGYLAAYFLASKKQYKHLMIYIVLILFPGNSIFNDLRLMHHTDEHPYYRVDHDVVDVGHYFEKQDERFKIIGVTDITRGIRIISTNVELVIDEYDLRQREYNLYKDEDLLNLFLAVNDQAPLLIDDFKSVTSEYEIDKVVVYKNSAICMQLTYHGYEKETVGKYAIITLNHHP
ncbi:DUF6077 domain-containing protein [Haloplasma contractile]|uniref:Uncharacterized protein n=1 Tax=Haloplasma contractile SSD-17B TaxID=1033810 RepID=F7Q1K9_9MOLU|nr:DUF6077 domain-containing protein [Haloplasma contractile]ERJ12940.1 hypothetical protein HLPCO_001280 [Haloplasma contractile SSD-17B]